QNITRSFDLGCCSRIEIDVTNADERAELVEIELLVHDSAKFSASAQTLGTHRLQTKPDSGSKPETLAFDIPSRTKVKTFDELIVRFRLVWPRYNDSAQVAIERFRLVPRGAK